MKYEINLFLFNAYKNIFSFLIYIFDNVFITIKLKANNENENNN